MYDFPFGTTRKYEMQKPQNPEREARDHKLARKEMFESVIIFLSTQTVFLLIATLVAWVIAQAVIPAAYAERGYEVIGGEWLLIITAFIATYYGTAQLYKARYEDK